MKIKVNWIEQIQKWEASGMSKQAFCHQESLGYQSFLYHLKRQHRREEKGSFKQLRIDAGAVDGKIDYYFGDGRRVSFPVATTKEMIRFVLSL
jgi:hypothetical protein